MARPEIVMETPAAKQLEAAVQRKLAEFSYSTADDVVMAEYVVVMLANSKTPAEITAELTELIGEDMYDPIFTDWLFEELARQYGPAPNSSAPAGESTVDIPIQAGTSDRSNSDIPTAGKIETVNDSREPLHSNRNLAKRVGNNGTNGNRTSQGVFNQALGGLKRSGGTDILKDTPPHRRLRSDEPFSGGGIPTGPRSMDRDSRDGGRPNVIPPRIGGGMINDRTQNNNGPRPAQSNFPPMRPGFGANLDVGAKSILERVGVLGNGARPFVNHNFQGGFANGQPRRMNDQLVDSLNGGRASMPPSLHAPFYHPGAPYSGPMSPNHPFPQHQYQQPSPNAPTPQLFLANGQPFIPSHPISHPLSASGGQIPSMYHQVLMNVPTTPNSSLSAQSPAFNPGQPMGYVPKPGAPESQSATPDLNLSPLPDKPSLRQECKYNLECKDAWCPSSHCSPCGNPKSSMLLNFDACEKQMQCTDSDCPKAHVSPQQRDPKSSIRIPMITHAVAPNTSAMPLQASTSAPSSNLTPCRFGTQCTRADCHFAHPWNTNPNTPGNVTGAGEVGKAPASTPFSTIRCKYAMACTRPNCHFQHPPKKTAASSFRPPSKNISKTFNTSDTVTASDGIDAAKLPPSKKFAAPQPEQADSSNKADKTVEEHSVTPSTSLKPKVEADLPVSNPSSNSAKPSIKTEANNGIQHQATSELSDIKPVLPVPVST
ncbi:hypothetical protein DFH28DRAFT_513772 [Melampsora americana]|nr:hypothetical protein DFH28DRAFT_513772 [Melampsora americana]